MGSRLFDEIREQRGLAYSVSAFPHAYADVPVLQLSAGLESSKCIEAYTRMREIVTELRERGPDRGRGRAGPGVRRRRAGDRVREHWRGRAPRGPADDRLRRGASTPTRRSRCSMRSRSTRCARSPRGIADELSVACVGPAHRGGAGERPETLARCARRARGAGGRRMRSDGATRATTSATLPAAPAPAPDDRQRRRAPPGRRSTAPSPARVRRSAAGARNGASGAGGRPARLRRDGLRPHRPHVAVRAPRRTSSGRPLRSRSCTRRSRCCASWGRAPACTRRARRRPPRSHGVWHGNLYLAGGGDPTFGDGTLQPDLGAGLRPDREPSSRASCGRRGSSGSPAG